MSIEIQSVGRQHFDEWLRLREAVYSGVDREFHLQEMELILDDRDKDCLMAFAATGEVCGIIELSLRNVVDGCLTSPVGYVEGIYVEPAHRGSGISRQLMQRAEQWCRERGCREMASDAELDNIASQRFHEHLGFEETYRIVEYRKTL